MAEEATPSRVQSVGAAAAERRAAPRHGCAEATDVLLPATGERLRARVRDVSRTGVGLAVTRPVPPGAALLLAVRRSAESRTVWVPARVVHCTGDDGAGWLLGCRLDWPIDEGGLAALLRQWR